ncbi:MFS transporter [Stackebrandtia nassauensis]|uniref:Major facilitator superfamily MFS_1 n=1 Tax=Stackebrandtia nassauensis (strain DSM 44728 / CIP 108903 / NRRL B-16338 / NBRC 102104 / LLR-40K-21) TaxID=446470 RepID=D3PUK7_STANL|nr:MFS transporter [Stackebrandtia nassauensis]ADD43020.1 major facilitator superfamily MFS_1 [Stackebrandtia nassauensis DSM 44728]
MTTGLTTRRRVLLAIVCAVAVSTIYGIQPVLEAAGRDLGMNPAALGWLVASGQIGYLAGLVLLVPLGDLLNRRRLITTHLVLIALGAAITAIAPTAAIAIAGLALAGLFAVVVQTTVAYVAAVSPPRQRGRDIGAVTSGVVIGILGVRVAAGSLADLADWRAVYLVLTGLSVLLAFATATILDADHPRPQTRYPRLLASLAHLAATDRLLRNRGLVAFFLFASFGTLWSGLALPLTEAPWHLTTSHIGLFGLAGLTGALGAARAGRWADRGLTTRVTIWSLGLLIASWLLIAQTGSSLWPLIVGIIALDFAVQAVHVSNQHLLTTAHPERSSTVIGAYMAFYSLGSALGAITTTWAYSLAGWPAASLLGAAYAALALLVAAALHQTPTRPHAKPADGNHTRAETARCSE